MTTKEPLIFITNDDGVNARGLAVLIEVARKFGRVVAVAPEYAQSGMSHSITMNTPLYLRTVRKEVGLEIYACDGKPVDCVKMAFDHLLKDEEVMLTLSGINHGSNSAVSILYSGTMGAAIEASFYGAPSIGFSLTDHDPEADLEASAIYAGKIIRQVLEGDPDLPLCLNVNFPAARPEEIRGIRLSRQCRGFWREEFVRRQDPRGKDYYWLTGDFHNAEPTAADTDEWALRNKYVSVVPVQVDLTNYTQIDRLKGVIRDD